MLQPACFHANSFSSMAAFQGNHVEATLLDDDELEELERYLETADPNRDAADPSGIDAHPTCDTDGIDIPPRKKRRAYPSILNFSALCDVTSTPEVAVEFCQSHGLLPRFVLCPGCEGVLSKMMTWNENHLKNHRLLFQCGKKKCRKSGNAKVFARKNTFFAFQKIPLRSVLLIAYSFVANFSMKQAQVEASSPGFRISENTILNHYHICRQVLVDAVSNQRKKKIGGPGFSVEVDESKFRESTTYTNASDGKEVKGQWVFGGICRETDECFLVEVENRTEDTLLSNILDNIEKGTTIYTDGFKGYVRLNELGYKHLTVKLNENFVDRETGASINKIQATWWAVKRFLPTTVNRKQKISDFLAEYLWRKGKDQATMFQEFLKEVARQFPGPGPSVLSKSSDG